MTIEPTEDLANTCVLCIRGSGTFAIVRRSRVARLGDDMAIRVAAHTMGIPHMTVSEGARFVKEAGYDAIELICQDDYRCGLAENASRAEVSETARMVEDAGLRVSCLVPYMKAFNSLDAARGESVMDAARRAVDMAAELSANGMRILTGEEVPEADSSRCWDAMIERLRVLAEYADAHGIDLWLENHMDTQVYTASEMAALVAAIGHPRVGITYDPCNLVIMGEDNNRAAFDIQAAHIRHVHLDDGRMKPEGGIVSTPLDGGEMPWRDWVRWLVETGYDGYLTAEYVYRWTPEVLPPPEEALPAEAVAIREAVSSAGGMLAS